MTKYVPVDYELPPAVADYLKGIVTIPACARYQALLLLAERLGGLPALVGVFAQFIGLANSVAVNCRELAEELLITEGNVHPHTAEKINLATVFGALSGISLAAGIDPTPLCAGCACRLGTPANQSPCTTADVDWCTPDDMPVFMCHAELDDRGEPIKACAGFAQKRAAARRAHSPEGC